MKLKKMIYLSVMFALIILLIIFGCLIHLKSSTNTINKVLIGNKITMETNKNEYDETFTFDYMSIAYLNKMLEIDASKIVDNKVKKLSSLLKESSLVVINIGIYDLKSVILEDSLNTKLIYDQEVLTRQEELVESLIVNVIQNIQSINDKIFIYLLKVDYPYSILDNYVLKTFESLNKNYKEICQKLNVNYCNSIQ